MPVASTARRQAPQFRPSQLVLCRYEKYPYWPATVDNVFPAEVLEGYRCHLTTNDGTFVFYWCMFCNEEKGGWVREDRLVLFHPSLVRYARVSAENSWYQEQQKAFRAAFKYYNALHSKALPPKPPDPIPDLLEVHRQGGDPEEPDVECISQLAANKREAKVEPTSDESATDSRHEPSLINNESSVPGFSGQQLPRKRGVQLPERNEPEEHIPSQKQRLDCLPITSGSPDLENLGEGAEVTFFAPPPPEDYPVVLPEKSTYLSRPANAVSFSEMMKNLGERITAYNESSKDAEEAHHIFDVEKENIRRKYKDLFERLGQVERRAADEKKGLVMSLQEILLARVDIADLKKHRAGTIIKVLGKECDGVPAIHTLCEEIAKVWAGVVDLYVNQYRESL